MTNSFRIDASELREWHESVARRIDVRGVAALAKELEAHVKRVETDGTVVVSRHQLFTWAEAIHGAAVRGAPELESITTQMRAILSGKPAGAPAPTRASAPPAAALAGDAPVAGSLAAIARAESPPAVTYTRAPVAPGAGGARLVSGSELANAVRDLLRGAQREVLISSPWDTGIETMLADIVGLAPTIAVRIVSRRPQRDDGPFHQSMDQLGRRKAVTAFSNHIQTRMVIVDDERALVGAASVPGAVSREAALLVADRATVAQLKAHFEKVHAEAAGGKS